jgi:hypothetical protein
MPYLNMLGKFYTVNQLKAMPTLLQLHFHNVKIQTDDFMVSIDRCTKEDHDGLVPAGWPILCSRKIGNSWVCTDFAGNTIGLKKNV